MQQNTLPDFDTLRKMAEENPESLERLRCKLTRQVIDGAPRRMRHRLEGLQFQIDCQRKLAKSPLTACIKISEMMHESLDTLRMLLNQISTQEEGKLGFIETRVPNQTNQTAKVVPFSKQQ